MSRGFDGASRQVIERALRHARSDGTTEIGTEHLFRALAEDTGVRELAGIDPTLARELGDRIARCRRLAGLSPADADALAAVGIDLDAVIEQVEAELGAGALDATGQGRRRLRTRLSTTARAALASASTHAASLGARELRPEHLLLGLLTRRDVVSDVLGGAGITVATLLTRLADPGQRAG